MILSVLSDKSENENITLIIVVVMISMILLTNLSFSRHAMNAYNYIKYSCHHYHEKKTHFKQKKYRIANSKSSKQRN